MTTVARSLSRNASSARHSTIKSFLPVKTLSGVFIVLFHSPASSLQHYLPHTRVHTTITVDLYLPMKSNNHGERSRSSRTAVFPSLITLFSKSERERRDTARVWRSKLISVPLRACLGDECAWGVRGACEASLSFIRRGRPLFLCPDSPTSSYPHIHHHVHVPGCLSSSLFLSRSSLHTLPHL